MLGSGLPERGSGAVSLPSALAFMAAPGGRCISWKCLIFQPKTNTDGLQTLLLFVHSKRSPILSVASTLQEAALGHEGWDVMVGMVGMVGCGLGVSESERF